MKMIGFEKPFKLEEGNLFKVYEQSKPTPENDDILVKVNSISVNPVDTKQRQMEVTQAPRVLGFDAIGTVEAIGPDVTLFSPGEKDQMRHICGVRSYSCKSATQHKC